MEVRKIGDGGHIIGTIPTERVGSSVSSYRGLVYADPLSDTIEPFHVFLSPHHLLYLVNDSCVSISNSAEST